MKKHLLSSLCILLTFFIISLPSLALISSPDGLNTICYHDTCPVPGLDSDGKQNIIMGPLEEKQVFSTSIPGIKKNRVYTYSPLPDDTTLNVTPLMTFVQTNTSFSINITVDSPHPISGVQCDIKFDSSLLTAQYIEEGNLFSPLETYFNPGIINNTRGIITAIYGGSILGNTTNPGTFARVYFTSKNTSGISLISFSNVVIGTPQGIPLSLINTAGIVAIQTPNQAPQIFISSPLNNTAHKGIIKISGNAFDYDGTIQRVELKVNQDPWISVNGTHTWSYLWNTTLLPNGIHTLFTRSYDGTTYSSLYQITLTVDNTPPVTNLSFVGIEGLNKWFTSDVRISLHSYDETTTVAHIKYQINNQSVQNYDTPFILTHEGRYTLNYYALDRVNNIEPYKTVTFGIDKTPPRTQHHFTPKTPTGDNGWYTQPVQIHFTTKDNISGGRYTWYHINCEDWILYRNTSRPREITTEGIHTITYYSTDNAGNEENYHSTMIKIDVIQPSVTLIKPKDNTLYLWDREIIPLSGDSVILGPITVMIDAKDTLRGIARVNVVIDDVIVFTDSFPPFHYTLNKRFLFPQKHSLYATASDFAGNTNKTSTKTIWVLNISKRL